MSNCLFGKCWIIHVAGVVCFVGDRAYDQKWNVIQVSHLCHRSPFHLSTVTFKSIDQVLLFFAVSDELVTAYYFSNMADYVRVCFFTVYFS